MNKKLFRKAIIFAVVALFIEASFVHGISGNVGKNIYSNNPPDKPDFYGIIEVEKGKEGFYFAKAIDPDGDDIYYKFDWGNNLTSEWMGPFPSGGTFLMPFTWNESGTFYVKVKAKDSHNYESEWSDELDVVVRDSFKDVEFIGGFGITIVFTNKWSKHIDGLSWSIDFIKSVYGMYNASGLVLGLFNAGSCVNIPPHGQVTLHTRFLFGIGPIFSDWNCHVDFEDGSFGQYSHWYDYWFVIGPFTILLPDPWGEELQTDVEMNSDHLQ